MESKNISRIIQKLAKQEGVSEHKIIREMEKAIQIGFNSTDPEIQDFWKEMPTCGKPSPAELIACIASLLERERLKA